VLAGAQRLSNRLISEARENAEQMREETLHEAACEGARVHRAAVAKAQQEAERILAVARRHAAELHLRKSPEKELYIRSKELRKRASDYTSKQQADTPPMALSQQHPLLQQQQAGCLKKLQREASAGVSHGIALRGRGGGGGDSLSNALPQNSPLAVYHQRRMQNIRQFSHVCGEEDGGGC